MKNLLFLIASTLILFTCAPKNKETQQRKSDIHNNGVNIVYDDSGSGDTTLLFVHGWGINRSYWSDQVTAFRSRYRVVSIDLPGFGESGTNRSEWTPVVFAADVDSVISQLHLKNVVLVGHSMSGDVVLQAAIDNPQIVVALIGVDNFKDIGYTPTENDKKENEEMMKALKENYTSSVTGFFNAALVTKTTKQELKTRILRDVFKNDSTIGYLSITDTTFHEANKVKESKRKIRLIDSDYQPIDSSWLMKNNVPYKIYWVRDVGHYPMNEKPDEFNAELKKALSDIARGN